MARKNIPKALRGARREKSVVAAGFDDYGRIEISYSDGTGKLKKYTR